MDCVARPELSRCAPRKVLVRCRAPVGRICRYTTMHVIENYALEFTDVA